MIKCGLCGKEFEDGHYDEYSSHVIACAAEQSQKKKTEEMKKINAELEEVKRAKVVYEGLRDSFKEKYPDVYKVNFQSECEEYKETAQNKIHYVEYDSNGKKVEKEIDFEDMELDTLTNLLLDMFGLSCKNRS